MEQDKGIQYLTNLVSVNTEIYNELEKFLPNPEDKDVSTPYINTIVNMGLNECVFKIREASRAARQIFAIDLEIQENIQQILNGIQPSYYIKDKTLYVAEGVTFKEAVEQTKVAVNEKFKNPK